MIHEALHRPVPVELTDDRRIRRRVKRLAAVSAVALGLIWALAPATLEAPAAVDAALLACAATPCAAMMMIMPRLFRACRYAALHQSTNQDT